MADVYLAISARLLLEDGGDGFQVDLHVVFKVRYSIVGVVELYRNVGGGIFTLEDEEVCVVMLFCCPFCKSISI